MISVELKRDIVRNAFVSAFVFPNQRESSAPPG